MSNTTELVRFIESSVAWGATAHCIVISLLIKPPLLWTDTGENSVEFRSILEKTLNNE